MWKTLLTVGCVLCLSSVAPAAELPNIVVFLVDDMGLMDTSVPFLTDADGKPQRHPLNDFYRTPGMERLAKQGVRFSQFYAMSVCSPTRVSLMTGQTSARHRTTNWINAESNNAGPLGAPDWKWQGITPDQATLPKLLKAAGYRTIHCGKAHFGPNDTYGELPQNFGFDVNIAGCAWGQPGSYYGERNFGQGWKGRERRAVPGLEKYHGQDIFLTDALTLELNAEITKSVEAKQPFFAYMAHYAVHAPFDADLRFAGNYPDRKPNVQAFASLIEGMDKSLNDLLDHLEKLGVAENTLVFFLGDNGTDAPLGALHDIACAAPLRGKKGTHYEGGMRVPFIAAWARLNPDNRLQRITPIPPGTIRTDVGIVSDLYPTILTLAGLEPGDQIDGLDLRSLLTGEIQARMAREFLMHFPHEHRSSYFTVYRSGDWKLIYHYHGFNGLRYELFNLAKDRDESRNLAKSEPAKLREMVAAMIQALEKTAAQMPLAEDKQTRLKPELPAGE